MKSFHKSFPDFITDPSQCTDLQFYISPNKMHLELVKNCLRMMNDGLEQNLLLLPDYVLNSEVEDLKVRISGCISTSLQYACRSWHNHLVETDGDVTDVVSCLHVFLEEKFLAWLEVVSAVGAVGGAVFALERLIAWLEVCFLPYPHHHLMITYCESDWQKQAASGHCQRLFSICDQVFRDRQSLHCTHLLLCAGTMPSVVDYSKAVLSPAHHLLAESGYWNPGFMGLDYSHF